MAICFARLVSRFCDRFHQNFERFFVRFQVRCEAALVAHGRRVASLLENAFQSVKCLGTHPQRFRKLGCALPARS